MENKIVVLGSGTCNLEIERANTAILICYNKTKIVYDFGYRVLHRLQELGFSPNDIQHIIISHFHPDHFSDLIPLIHSALYSKFPRKNILNIYSSRQVNNFIDLIKRLMLSRGEFEKIIKIYTLSDKSEYFSINNLKINYKIFSHFENVAIKFDINKKSISISGDINFKKDDLSFFENSDLCFLNVGDLKENEIINLKKDLKIKKLILLHAYSKDSFKDKLFLKNIIIGNDLMEFNL